MDDEYDMYIGRIHTALMEGSSDTELAQLLLSIETERMELPGTPAEKLLLVAQKLLGIPLPSNTPPDASMGPD